MKLPQWLRKCMFNLALILLGILVGTIVIVMIIGFLTVISHVAYGDDEISMEDPIILTEVDGAGDSTILISVLRDDPIVIHRTPTQSFGTVGDTVILITEPEETFDDFNTLQDVQE